MTEEKLVVDEEDVPVIRVIKPLGLGWSFDKYKMQGDEWKNAAPYQILVGLKRMREKRNSRRTFVRVHTGAKLVISQKKDEQKAQQAALDEIDIPIIWEEKGLPIDLCFYEYETEKKKSLEK